MGRRGRLIPGWRRRWRRRRLLRWAEVAGARRSRILLRRRCRGRRARRAASGARLVRGRAGTLKARGDRGRVLGVGSGSSRLVDDRRRILRPLAGAMLRGHGRRVLGPVGLAGGDRRRRRLALTGSGTARGPWLRGVGTARAAHRLSLRHVASTTLTCDRRVRRTSLLGARDRPVNEYGNAASLRSTRHHNRPTDTAQPDPRHQSMPPSKAISAS